MDAWLDSEGKAKRCVTWKGKERKERKERKEAFAGEEGKERKEAFAGEDRQKRDGKVRER
jgi:hypothetical protein